VDGDLRVRDLGRERVLAGAVRLLDLGLFRIGGEEYAEHGGGLGLATLHKKHVKLRNGAAVFDYPAKSGIQRVHQITDPAAVVLVTALKRRRGGGSSLLAYRRGRRWHAVRSDDINDYLKAQIGEEFSAKDFRTWNATVLAAVALLHRSARLRPLPVVLDHRAHPFPDDGRHSGRAG
jgi:DNA topoisomerase-1